MSPRGARELLDLTLRDTPRRHDSIDLTVSDPVRLYEVRRQRG